MLERFRLSYLGSDIPERRFGRAYHFSVTADQGNRRHVRVDTAWIEAEENGPALALARLERELQLLGSRLFEVHRVDANTVHEDTAISLPREEFSAAQEPEAAQKACVWQVRELRRWICVADVGPPSEPTTTPRQCGACNVPDERVVCAHLMQPGIQLRTSEHATTRLMVTPPGCMIGNQAEDGSECRLDGKDCWERVVKARTSAPADPPSDVPRSVADELDFLRLVARDVLNLPNAIPVAQARSISELFGTCDSAEDLQRRLAALGDLVNRFDFIDALDQPDQLDDQGQRRRSLGALDKLLEVKQTGLSGPSGPAAVLRSIIRVRNTFPIHTQPEARESFRDLGIDYPPADWHSAWVQILVHFWSSIRQIREALQTL